MKPGQRTNPVLAFPEYFEHALAVRADVLNSPVKHPKRWRARNVGNLRTLIREAVTAGLTVPAVSRLTGLTPGVLRRHYLPK